MTLLELYNLKLYEYKESGIRERPHKLLAMLLLSEKDKYELVDYSTPRGGFYEKYKEEIDKKIAKVERDFELTHEDIVRYIEEKQELYNYEHQRLWNVYREGFIVVSTCLIYGKGKTAEEIYSEYIDADDLKKYHDTNESAVVNNITITKLDDLINKVLENPKTFYEQICNELTAEERLFIIKILANKSCITCTNGSCRVESYEKIGLNEFGEPQGSKCAQWFNAELIGRSKVLRKSDINELR